MTPAYPAGEMPQYLGGLRMPPRRRAFAPGMAAGRREENYFSAPQGQNPPQNRQNPRNRNENPHRQSRPAASRIAGASNRSRQPTGDSRPPSLGEKSRKGFPLPGFRRKPERTEIIFPGDTRGGKNSSHGATCRDRLGGPGAQAERYHHRRNAGAGSWKWRSHFPETPHGATCRGRLSGPGAKAERYRHRRNAGADSGKWRSHFPETLHGAKCGRKAAFGRSCGRTRAE